MQETRMIKDNRDGTVTVKNPVTGEELLIDLTAAPIEPFITGDYVGTRKLENVSFSFPITIKGVTIKGEVDE